MGEKRSRASADEPAGPSKRLKVYRFTLESLESMKEEVDSLDTSSYIPPAFIPHIPFSGQTLSTSRADDDENRVYVDRYTISEISRYIIRESFQSATMTYKHVPYGYHVGAVIVGDLNLEQFDPEQGADVMVVWVFRQYRKCGRIVAIWQNEGISSQGNVSVTITFTESEAGLRALHMEPQYGQSNEEDRAGNPVKSWYARSYVRLLDMGNMMSVTRAQLESLRAQKEGSYGRADPAFELAARLERENATEIMTDATLPKAVLFPSSELLSDLPEDQLPEKWTLDSKGKQGVDNQPTDNLRPRTFLRPDHPQFDDRRETAYRLPLRPVISIQDGLYWRTPRYQYHQYDHTDHRSRHEESWKSRDVGLSFANYRSKPPAMEDSSLELYRQCGCDWATSTTTLEELSGIRRLAVLDNPTGFSALQMPASLLAHGSLGSFRFNANVEAAKIRSGKIADYMATKEDKTDRPLPGAGIDSEDPSTLSKPLSMPYQPGRYTRPLPGDVDETLATLIQRKLDLREKGKVSQFNSARDEYAAGPAGSGSSPGLGEHARDGQGDAWEPVLEELGSYNLDCHNRSPNVRPHHSIPLSTSP